jgi:hypothetical protein
MAPPRARSRTGRVRTHARLLGAPLVSAARAARACCPHALRPPRRTRLPNRPPACLCPAGEAGAAGVVGACYVAYSLRDTRSGAALYLGFNCHDYPVTASLPLPPPGKAWHRLADTAQLPPDDVSLDGGPVLTAVGGTSYTVLRKGAVVFDTVPAAGGRPF